MKAIRSILSCRHLLKPAGRCIAYSRAGTPKINGNAIIQHVGWTARRYLWISSADLLPLPHNVRHSVRVTEFQSSVAGKPAQVIEKTQRGSEIVELHYTKFQSSARVHLPAIPEGEEWHIGYVQAVRKNLVSDHFGDSGTTKTIIPELTFGTQEMVADTAGSQYIWYEAKNVSKRKGPAKEQSVLVKMSDYPSSISHTNNDVFLAKTESGFQAASRVLSLHKLLGRAATLLPPKTEKRDLSLLSRHIEFCTWLVIRCAQTDEVHVLRSIQWDVNLQIEYDITKRKGERTTFIDGNGLQNPPRTQSRNLPDIPACVFHPPCANEAIAIIWEPYDQRLPERVVKPPKWNPDYQHR